MTVALRAVEAWRALRGGRAGQGGGLGPDGLPLPPAKLIVRVAGVADAGWFQEGGRLAAETIREVLASQGTSLDQFAAIVDFGCGCGRVVRHWQSLTGPTISGTDYDPDLIAWCRA